MIDMMMKAEGNYPGILVAGLLLFICAMQAFMMFYTLRLICTVKGKSVEHNGTEYAAEVVIQSYARVGNFSALMFLLLAAIGSGLIFFAT